MDRRGKRNRSPKKASPVKETADSSTDSDSSHPAASYALTKRKEELVVDLHGSEDAESTKAKSAATGPDIDAFDDVEPTPPAVTAVRQRCGSAKAKSTPTGTTTDTPPPPPPGGSGKAQASTSSSGRRIITTARSVEDYTLVTVKKRGSYTECFARVLAGIKCYTALLIMNDNGVWEGVQQFGALPAVLDPVARIDNLLAMQVDATITCGNTGGPCLNKQCAWLGIVFLSSKNDAAEYASYVIPIPQHFLQDFESTGYTGFSVLNLKWQNMENSVFSRAMRLGQYQKGIRIRRIERPSNAYNFLLPSKIDGVNIGNDGTVGYLISQNYVGEKVEVEVLRGGIVITTVSIPYLISEIRTCNAYHVEKLRSLVALIQSCDEQHLILDLQYEEGLILQNLTAKALTEESDLKCSKGAICSPWIPEELIHLIFSSLETKRLFQMTQMSKHWNNMITAGQFPQQAPRDFILALCPRNNQIHEGEGGNSIGYFSYRDRGDLSRLPDLPNLWLPEYLHGFRSLEVCGPVRGVLCVSDRFNICLINPSTRVIRKIRDDPDQGLINWRRVSIGFGYNRREEDFTIVHVTEAYDPSVHAMDMSISCFCLMDNAWDSIHPPFGMDLRHDNIMRGIRGMVYDDNFVWPALSGGRDYVLTCDIRNETINRASVADYVREQNPTYRMHLMRYLSKIGIVMCNDLGLRVAQTNNNFQISEQYECDVLTEFSFDNLVPDLIFTPLLLWDDKGVLVNRSPPGNVIGYNFGGFPINHGFDILGCKWMSLCQERTDINISY